jgi:hypothetical protein
MQKSHNLPESKCPHLHIDFERDTCEVCGEWLGYRFNDPDPIPHAAPRPRTVKRRKPSAFEGGLGNS